MRKRSSMDRVRVLQDAQVHIQTAMNSDHLAVQRLQVRKARARLQQVLKMIFRNSRRVR